MKRSLLWLVATAAKTSDESMAKSEIFSTKLQLKKAVAMSSRRCVTWKAAADKMRTGMPIDWRATGMATAVEDAMMINSRKGE
jgi:hypothetical protein